MIGDQRDDAISCRGDSPFDEKADWFDRIEHSASQMFGYAVLAIAVVAILVLAF